MRGALVQAKLRQADHHMGRNQTVRGQSAAGMWAVVCLWMLGLLRAYNGNTQSGRPAS